MEGLFFVIDPVWWIGSISLASIVISITWSSLVGFFLFYRNLPKWDISRVTDSTDWYNLINPNDSLFIEKTLTEIRHNIAQRYFPKHTWAHLPDDMKSYITDPWLIDIIRQLEWIEYTGKNIEIQEKELINNQLLLHLNK